MEAHYRNPAPTVDIIIEIEDAATSALRGIVLIERKNPPHGWAIPGGFVDYGESVEHAAEREALEETSLRVRLVRQFHVYSDPARDPRQHTISTVFVARAQGERYHRIPKALYLKKEKRVRMLERRRPRIGRWFVF